jgi:hypothetical protein
VKSAVIALGAAAVLAALVLAVAAASAPSSPAASAQSAQIFNRPGVDWQFGYVRALTPRGSRYELRFDPALWLGGVTANRAAVDDGVIKAGETVPNDYYIRNERPRTLSYIVPANAKATVLTATASIRSARIPISELAQIVKGRNPKQRALMDRRNHLGFWIAVRIDRVRSLDQQYQP